MLLSSHNSSQQYHYRYLCRQQLFEKSRNRAFLFYVKLMKQFFKTFLAALLAFFVGSIITSCISLFVAMAMFAGFAAAGKQVSKIPQNAILEVDLSHVSEVVETTPFDNFGFGNMTGAQSLRNVLEAIERAKNHPDIVGIYLKSPFPVMGMASLSEVRQALEEFRSTGKFIVSYADIYSQKGYYLASAADHIYLNPSGMIELNGIVAQTMFYRGILEKLGVEMQIFKVGTYKGAVEPFMLDKLSDANREQIASYTHSLWGQMIDKISTARHIQPDSLNRIVDQAPVFFDPSRYAALNLIDELLYERQVKEKLAALTFPSEEVPSKEDLRFVSITEMLRSKKIGASKRHGDDVIHVVYAEGAIEQGIQRKNITEELAEELLELADDDDIDAVVLRVNSPGGSAYISEQIWDAVMQVKAEKPIVVSMGDYAASGGYYISCAANYIYAEPATITGSIGIFGMFPNFAGTAKMIGLTTDRVKTNEFADLGDVTRPMRPEERVILQGYIERGYEQFLKRVGEGRSMTRNQVDSIAQGRVWTGEQALERKLVDALGGIDDAILKAAELANTSQYRVTYGKTEIDPFERWLQNLSNAASTHLMSRFLTEEEMEALAKARTLRNMTGVQARLVYDIE